MRFQDQVVVVTGGTRGIGKGITHNFLKEGAIVVATYASNDAKAQEFKASMQEYGEKLVLRKFDVSDNEACKTFFDSLKNDHEQIHVLVNNSGIRKDNLIATMSSEDWDQVLNINLKGTYNMTQQAVLHMMKHRYGRIVNISSIGGALGLPGQANYAASKAGQVALSKSVSKEVAKRKNVLSFSKQFN